ncbi:TetR/AcrR family transcriptional regulator [Algoriphagus halophytocola]|uniref:TetR/AcrR family transcriptional regulator n=1 Tax=Algoriphagus halophytocola TaxID=2991499 RepID=A0ABY6MG45_9BACT|nr:MULTISPECIES: TetR/AcrR family transcriptional regulator [unclassified Algoriphagus]UZD22608.1 TetR/AcrR family transcriptional regulator [Algoriphagus sp. TR-M5]WBL43874.1 TetR/AcrR family transcriptional regulator [Algoriphagus sp. TR-M9]
MRQKILEVAIEQFSHYGVRIVTMEDIARLIGISKKTLYQEFKDKKELIKEAFSTVLEQDCQKLQDFADSKDGVIEHLVQTSKMVRERLSAMNPLVIIEIQRYFPDTWEVFERYREEVIETDLVNVLERGKKLGYFRPEINSAILAKMRVEQISAGFNMTNLRNSEFTLVEMQVSVLDHFLHGIFTDKGRESYLQKQNLN